METRRMLATEAESDGYVSSVHEAMRLAPDEVTNGDAALAALVADGDRAALERVFDQYAGAVKSVAARVLREEGLA
ncbi:MAG TPA: hypothetical protein VF115_07080, partial [Acidimicrobiia bacterium]